MIKIFGPKENNFTSNGIVTFKPFKLVETKKISLNGWHIEVDAPLEYEEYLKQDMLCVVKVKSRLKPQAFRIKNTKKTQRKISFEAVHVLFDARNYFLLDARPVNMSAVGALKYINERTDIKSPFTFSSDVNNSATAYFIRKNLFEALTVIEERWGGYYEADNWHISLKKEIGQDRGEVVSYGKNLESIQVTEDWSNVVTKLYPVGFDGLLLPEKYLESAIKYDQPYTKTIQFETKYEDEDRTIENLLPELIANATDYLEKNQYPMVNYEVKSNINEFMEVGDTIHVKHPLVDIKTEVQEYTYDILAKRTTSLVFGNYSRDVKKKFESIRNDLETLKGNKSELEAIIGNQTDLINSLNKNGHVVIDDNQILILDKLPKTNAKYVWRWNMGGLAFSENGVEGPYKQAWTIDGVFNTDFISAGTIMTNHLHSDVGSSLDISSNESINFILNNVGTLSESITKHESELRIHSEGIELNTGLLNKHTSQLTEASIQLNSLEGTINTMSNELNVVVKEVQEKADKGRNLLKGSDGGYYGLNGETYGTRRFDASDMIYKSETNKFTMSFIVEGETIGVAAPYQEYTISMHFRYKGKKSGPESIIVPLDVRSSTTMTNFRKQYSKTFTIEGRTGEDIQNAHVEVHISRAWTKNVDVKHFMIVEGDEVPEHWELAADDSMVSDKGVVGAINATPTELNIKWQKINFEGMITANKNFWIDEEGNMGAKDGTFTGYIGEWKMDTVIESKSGQLKLNSRDNSITFNKTQMVPYTTDVSSGIHISNIDDSSISASVMSNQNFQKATFTVGTPMKLMSLDVNGDAGSGLVMLGVGDNIWTYKGVFVDIDNSSFGLQGKFDSLNSEYIILGGQKYRIARDSNGWLRAEVPGKK